MPKNSMTAMLGQFLTQHTSVMSITKTPELGRYYLVLKKDNINLHNGFDKSVEKVFEKLETVGIIKHIKNRSVN